MDIIEYYKYMTLPWKPRGRDLEKDGGVDCWGLVLLIYKDFYDLSLDDFESISPSNGYTATSEQISSAICGYKDFKEITDAPKQAVANDIVIFNAAGQPLHAGVCLDNKRFMHMDRNSGVTVGKFNSMEWKNRIQGIYRYKANI